MKLSLVQTSQNRHDELVRFVKSLNAQINIDFKEIQLIFIDQGNNESAFEQLNPNIELVYLRHELCSLSKARNLGLNYVKGDYVAFPDDDCWYEPNTLAEVFINFEHGYEGVVAKGMDENDNLTNNFPSKQCKLSKFNHCGAISYCIFLKQIPGLTFDEKLGVGSYLKLSSGEEVDFLLKTMDKIGVNMIYCPTIIVRHPSNSIGLFHNTIQKQYEYARGWGYLLYKHKFPMSIIIKSYARPIGGIVLYYLSLNFFRVKRSFYLLKGRLEGYFIAMKYGRG